MSGPHEQEAVATPGPRRPPWRRAGDRSVPWIVPILLFVAWELGASVGFVDARLFPPPSTILGTAWDLLADGRLQAELLISGWRVVAGFLLGSVVGVVVGAATGLARTVRRLLEPTLSAVYTVPKLALLPLLLIIFGVGDTPKILLIAMATFFIVWIATMAAFTGIPRGYRDVAVSFGGSRWTLLRHVLVPAALPQIFTGLRLAAGISVLMMVGAEFVQGGDGIGNLIWASWNLFMADRMYVGIVAVALMGLFATRLIEVVGRWLFPWAPEAQDGRDVIL